MDLTASQTLLHDQFICSICYNLLEDPVITTCQHMFCRACLSSWVVNKRVCPLDRRTLTDANSFTSLKTREPFFYKTVYQSLRVKCPNVECTWTGSPDAVEVHGLTHQLIPCPFTCGSDTHIPKTQVQQHFDVIHHDAFICDTTLDLLKLATLIELTIFSKPLQHVIVKHTALQAVKYPSEVCMLKPLLEKTQLLQRVFAAMKRNYFKRKCIVADYSSVLEQQFYKFVICNFFERDAQLLWAKMLRDGTVLTNVEKNMSLQVFNSTVTDTKTHVCNRITLPVEIVQGVQGFDELWTLTQHEKQTLHVDMGQGYAELEVAFEHGTQDLRMSSLQMAIVLMFNDNVTLTTQDIFSKLLDKNKWSKKHCKAIMQLCTVHLMSLATKKCFILQKTPTTNRTLLFTDVFKLNTTFQLLPDVVIQVPMFWNCPLLPT